MNGIKSAVDSEFKKYPQLKEKYDLIRFSEPLITNDIQEMAERFNTKLFGLEYCVKSASSIEDKIERKKEYCGKTHKNFNLEKQLNQTKDLIRYTQICEHDDICNVTKDTIKFLEDKGYILSEFKNYYKNPYEATGYMGIHLGFISNTGQLIEIQVHSEKSFEAKQRGHELYEKIRSVSTPVSVKDKLKEQILEIHSSVGKPKDYEKLTLENLGRSRMNADEIENICALRRDSITTTSYNVKQEDYKLNIYNIVLDGKNNVGFECIFKDNSIWEYKNINSKAELFVISKCGEEVAYRQGDLFKEKDFTHDNIIEYVQNQINNHEKWMEKQPIEVENEIDFVTNNKEETINR